MKTLKTAIIGGGRIAEMSHVPALRACGEEVELCAVCGRSPEKVQAMAARCGIPHAYTDAEEMLDAERPDLVVICTPNASHGPYTAMCLSRGIHVLCEKPVTIDAAEAERLYALAEEKGVTLTACQSRRFRPEWLAARQAVASGLLGQVYYADLVWVRKRGIPTWGSFHKKAENSGGVMADLGVHGLDSLIWMVGGEPVSICGSMGAPLVKALPAAAWDTSRGGNFRPEDFNVEEYAVGSALLSNGVQCNFRFTWAANEENQSRLLLCGTKASLSAPDLTVVPAEGEPYQLPLPESDGATSHGRLIAQLVNAILHGGELPVKPAETLAVTRLLDAFYACAHRLDE